MPTLSLRNRLLLIILSVFLVAWVVMTALTYVNTRHEIEQVFEAQMAQALHVLNDLTQHEIEEMGPAVKRFDMLDDIRFHPYEKKLAFQVWRGEDTLLMFAPSSPRTRMTSVDGYSNVTIEGTDWRVLSRTFPDRDNLQIIVGERREVRDQLIHKILVHVFWPILIALPPLVLFIMLGIQRGLLPLNKLSDEIADRSPTQLSPVSIEGLPEEIIPLIVSLNSLLNRLSYALDNERRFTADAAHELRTPLAALKAQAQVAARSDNKEQRINAIENTIRGMDRLTRLVEQLLTLARLDPEDAVKQHQAVNLEKIVESVSSELALAALNKKLHFELVRKGKCIIKGQDTALSVLVRNLIDNAIRYTPDGEKIIISVYAHNSQVVFSVCDSGPGIPDKDRQRIFDRFYRIIGTKAEGSGLGLSIVKRIADIHNAILEILTPENGKGTEFRVTFQALEQE